MAERTHIVLGDRVRCRITGFEGIATARTNWIYGCVRFGVQREILNEKGQVLEPHWADEEQLVIVERNAHITAGLLEASTPVQPKPKKEPAKPRRRRAATGGPDRGEALDDLAETG